MALAVLWILARPAGIPTGTYIGQLIGAESVLLLSIGMALISMLAWVESWFDGVDRAAIWHRRVAVAGVALLLPHIALATNPTPSAVGPLLGALGLLGMLGLSIWSVLPRWRRLVPRPLRGVIVALRDAPGVRHIRRSFGGYERWRAVHRLTGVFLVLGAAHGVLDATPFRAAPLLRWTYLAITGAGLALYLYRELPARFNAHLHDYEVAAVRRLDSELVEVTLRAQGRRLEFVPGQWAMLYLDGPAGRQRHPFTISSGSDDELLRVTIKALGDATSRAHLIEAGMPALIGGPHGRFDHRVGAGRQIWIAAGIGVAPFLSWLRSANGAGLPGRIDFFYSAAGEAPFAGEIEEIAARYEGLDLHLVDTTVEDRLTVDEVLATAGGNRRGLSVFMCGPTEMLRSFQAQLRRAGIPGSHIRHEYFEWR